MERKRKGKRKRREGEERNGGDGENNTVSYGGCNGCETTVRGRGKEGEKEGEEGS